MFGEPIDICTDCGSSTLSNLSNLKIQCFTVSYAADRSETGLLIDRVFFHHGRQNKHTTQGDRFVDSLRGGGESVGRIKGTTISINA